MPPVASQSLGGGQAIDYDLIMIPSSSIEILNDQKISIKGFRRSEKAFRHEKIIFPAVITSSHQGEVVDHSGNDFRPIWSVCPKPTSNHMLFVLT